MLNNNVFFLKLSRAACSIAISENAYFDIIQYRFTGANFKLSCH